MTLKRAFLCVAVFAGLAGLFCPSTAMADDTAASLLKKGKALLKKKNFSEAVLVLMKAKALAPSPQIQLEMAAAYEGLESQVEAAQIYEALSGDSGLDDKDKARSNERLKVLRQKLGRLTITCKVEGAEVTINGREIGTTPLPHAVYVEPGDISIVVGSETRKTTVDREVKAGDDLKIPVKLKRKSAAAAPPPTRSSMDPVAPPSQDAPPPPAKNKYNYKYGGTPGKGAASSPRKPGWFLGRRWTWIAAGGAVLTGIVGMAVGLSAAVEFNDYKDSSTPSSQYTEMEDSISAKATAANVFYGLTGALIATTVVLYFIEGPGPERRAKRRTNRKWSLSAGPTARGAGGQAGFNITF